MKFRDLLRMSSSNLWKRKVRTVLTVLGVVIGVAAIVVMISLGLGLSRSLTAQYESYGSLTQVTVQEPWNGGSSDEEEKRLDDKLVAEIELLEHVESVYPVMTMNVLAKYGGYEGYLQLQAMPAKAFENLGIKVGEGRLPGKDEELTFFYGNQVLMNFSSKNGQDYWSTGVMPDIDLMRAPIFTIFDMDAYYQSQGTQEEGATPVTPPKKYLIPACGVEELNEDEYSQYGWYTFCDIDQLIPELKRIFKNKVIPGQPSTKTGKPYKEIFYNELHVNVDDMDHVMEIQNYLTNLGYEAHSNAEWLDSEQ